jgi:hypothetical protein
MWGRFNRPDKARTRTAFNFREDIGKIRIFRLTIWAYMLIYPREGQTRRARRRREEGGIPSMHHFAFIISPRPPCITYITQLLYFMIALLYECLFPRVLAIFWGNQHKLLSMNNLRAQRGFSNQAKSTLIKVN